MSSGKGKWLQGPREEFDTELVCTCSNTNSSLHSHMQTHSCTTSKPDSLPGPSSPKERVMKSMILSISHPLTCKGRKTLDRGRPLGHLLELISPLLLLIWHCDRHHMVVELLPVLVHVKEHTICPGESLWIVVGGPGTVIALTAFLLVTTLRNPLFSIHNTELRPFLQQVPISPSVRNKHNYSKSPATNYPARPPEVPQEPWEGPSNIIPLLRLL